MCETCRTVPPVVPPAPMADMLPAMTVIDTHNQMIAIAALELYAESYITRAEGILADPRTTSDAALTIMSNMINVTERVCGMIAAIVPNDTDAPVIGETA